MSSHFKIAGKLRMCLLLASCVLLFGSCYSYRLATHAQPGSEFQSTTAHSFFWGLVQKPTEIQTPVCDSLGATGVAVVQVRTNLGYALLTVVTLGIWCPMKVEWKCSKPCPKEGKL